MQDPPSPPRLSNLAIKLALREELFSIVVQSPLDVIRKHDAVPQTLGARQRAPRGFLVLEERLVDDEIVWVDAVCMEVARFVH